MKSIESLDDINQKKILLRLDLNVPIKNGNITDATRIDKILPTIKFLLKNNAKIIILSHVGRPKGRNISELSLRPICDDIKNKINVDIKFIKKNIKEISSNDLFIDPDENNPRATRVYNKAGFEPAGTFKVDKGFFEGHQSLLMVKRLK